MIKGIVRVDWQSKAITELIKTMALEEESVSAKRIWAYAIKNVPVGNQYIFEQQGKNKKKFRWFRKRTPGTLMRSIKDLSSRFKNGGRIVFAGDERLAYYAHWIEFGTVFFKQRRRGYRYLRGALLREKREFSKRLQAALED